MDPDKREQLESASLSRDQLTPTAREPKGDAEAEGWGSFDRVPMEDRADVPVLEDTRVKADPRAPGGVETYAPRLNDTQGWPSDPARDFRVEAEHPETVRPVSEPPPSEAGEDEPESSGVGRPVPNP